MPRSVNPLLSFTHSSANRRRLPTPERLLYEFRRLRARYPWVTDYASWNEANHCGEPTCHRPELVAAYWRKLRRECPTCRILAAEVLDMPNMTSWVKAFRRAAKVEPRYWGLHNYIDANRLRTTGTRRLLQDGARPGVVHRDRRDRLAHEPPQGDLPRVRRARGDGHALPLRQLVPLSRRITRVYVYQWNCYAGPKTWDSGLIGPSGKPRPAFRVLQRVLAQRAARSLGAF